MRIGEMTFMGLQVWPPQWYGSGPIISHKAVLIDVKHIIGTNLLRIDIEHNGIPHLGIMSVAKGERESLYYKLKENVGIPLAGIADLEVD